MRFPSVDAGERSNQARRFVAEIVNQTISEQRVMAPKQIERAKNRIRFLFNIPAREIT